jgi:uncharacterized protein YxjI
MFRRRDERGGGTATTSAYQMHQQMFAIGDDFWIEDGAGRRAFKVDGKALRIRKTLVLEDGAGRELYKIKEKLVTIRDVMEIETDSGTVATVKKALISPLREHFEVELAGRGKWDVQGKITDHEYEVSGPGGRIATVSKKWFRVRDTYGVEIAPGQDDAFVLAVAIVVDQMSHPHR